MSLFSISLRRCLLFIAIVQSLSLIYRSMSVASKIDSDIKINDLSTRDIRLSTVRAQQHNDTFHDSFNQIATATVLVQQQKTSQSITKNNTEKCEATDGRPCKWYPALDSTDRNIMTCVYSANYPDVAKQKGGLFDSKMECCTVYCTSGMSNTNNRLAGALPAVCFRNRTKNELNTFISQEMANQTKDAWVASTQSDHVGHSNTCHDCLPSSSLRWTRIRKHPSPCDCLAGKLIWFIGDSYVRHAYVSFILWLSGDYARGALNPSHDAACEGQGQFTEKVCRGQISRRVTIPSCGGATVALSAGAWPTIGKSELSKADYVVWGAGNHPVDGNYDTRIGVNDAYIVQFLKIRPTCSRLPHTELADKVVWLSPHARLTSTHIVEERKALHAYHDEMPSVLMKECGVTKIASVWDATEALVDLHPHDAANMTWDGAHWGGQVNAYKAYAIFNAIMGDT